LVAIALKRPADLSTEQKASPKTSSGRSLYRLVFDDPRAFSRPIAPAVLL
jgi:hypothetical protein